MVGVYYMSSCRYQRVSLSDKKKQLNKWCNKLKLVHVDVNLIMSEHVCHNNLVSLIQWKLSDTNMIEYH